MTSIAVKEYRELIGSNKKPSKHRNVRTTVNGQKFDSKWEGQRYIHLLWLQENGDIKDLNTQVKFALKVDGELICNYFADFTYNCSTRGFVVEDAKGGKTTALFRLKKKLMKVIHGLDVVEVRKEKG